MFSAVGLLLLLVACVSLIPWGSPWARPLCFLPHHMPRAVRTLGTQSKHPLALDHPSLWLVTEGDHSPHPSLVLPVSHGLGLGCGAHLSRNTNTEHPAPLQDTPDGALAKGGAFEAPLAVDMAGQCMGINGQAEGLRPHRAGERGAGGGKGRRELTHLEIESGAAVSRALGK